MGLHLNTILFLGSNKNKQPIPPPAPRTIFSTTHTNRKPKKTNRKRMLTGCHREVGLNWTRELTQQLPKITPQKQKYESELNTWNRIWDTKAAITTKENPKPTGGRLSERTKMRERGESAKPPGAIAAQNCKAWLGGFFLNIFLSRL